MNADNEQFQMERVNDVAFRALTEQMQEPRELIGRLDAALHQEEDSFEITKTITIRQSHE